jgi:hypothetical protein
MKAPSRRTTPAKLPLKAARHVKSCVKSAQITPASFTPDMDKRVTQTVGTNPNAPSSRQQSAGPVDPIAPYSAASPVSYSPFGMSGGTFY